MAANPAFAATPKLYVAQVTTADTALNNPSTGQVTVFTAGGAGEKVLQVDVEAAQAAIAAAIVRLFISKDGGTNKRIFDEFLITAVTGSNTALGFRASKTYDNLNLELNDIMYATTSITQTMNVWVATAQY